jgi:hypothetical protein
MGFRGEVFTRRSALTLSVEAEVDGYSKKVRRARHKGRCHGTLDDCVEASVRSLV